MTNVFADIPRSLPNELVTTLIESDNVRIERIVSFGHVSPNGFWYDQDYNEWVMVLKGAATVRFEEEVVEMKPRRFRQHPGAQETPGRVGCAGRADDLAGGFLRIA